MRAISTVGSFFVVLGLYFLYGWVVVPFLLPLSAESEQRIVSLEDPTDEEIEPFLFLFPENGWERNPESEIHYLQFGQTIILFGKDEAQGNLVKLQPCTVLMVQGLDDPNLTENERKELLRQAIVMRTPLYAEIEFDREFNLGQFPLPDIKSGRLSGKVTIESAMKETGQQDDLFLETENVSITESPGLTKISTLKDVRFRFGYHYGEGSMFSMELALSNPNQPKSPKELSLLRFEKLKQLNLVFPEDPKSAPKIQTETVQTQPLAPNTPPLSYRIVPSCPATLLNIKCQREFVFRSAKAEKPNDKVWIATFSGNADVLQTNPDGSNDLLTAEEIQVKFQTPNKTQNIAKPVAGKTNNLPQTNGLGDLEPVSFEANGKLAQNDQAVVPARLKSQQNGGVLMTGDHILYDLRKNLLALETQTLSGASKEVEMIFQNRYVIRGEKSFQYTLGQNGEFGKLVSDGKGTLQGNIGDEKTPKKLFLSWNTLLAEPYPVVKNQIVLKLGGGIAADLEGFGKMTAGKLDLWCNIEPQKTPAAKTVDPKIKENPNLLPGLHSAKNSPFGDKNNVMPDRAVVMDKVHFVNEKGTCDVNRLDIFFKTISPAGVTAQSRWTPRILTDFPPLIPGRHQPAEREMLTLAGGLAAVLPNAEPDTVIQQVQFVQPNRVAKPETTAPHPTATIIPLYQSQPAPPVGNSVALPSTGQPARQNHSGALVPGSVASQNLLGLQSQTTVQYAITGKQMSMQVVHHDGNSNVETLAVEGNVRIVEKIPLENTANNAIIEITGEEITVWNPSSPETQILILGKQQDAVFQGRGVELRAKEINIARSSNKIWVPGVGRLIANTNSESARQYFQANPTPTTQPANKTLNPLTPLSPLKTANSAKDNRLLVEWNESMIFNGKVLQFLGKPDKNGNRVRAIHLDKEIWCDVMEIHLNRLVLFFEDKSNIKPEAEMIQCANNVFIRSRELDESYQLKSMSSAEFGKLRFYVASNYFVAEGPNDRPGVLSFTNRSSEEGFSASKMGLPETIAKGDEGGLRFLSVWFHDHVQGTFLGGQRNVEIVGRVQTAYLPVDSWDDHIGIDNLNLARKRGYILECDQLHIVEMPDVNNANLSTMELTALGNASIDSSKFYGKARTIKYNQAKTQVTFDGNAKILTFEDGKKSEQTAAELIQYDLTTKAIRLNQSQGIRIGQ